MFSRLTKVFRRESSNIAESTASSANNRTKSLRQRTTDFFQKSRKSSKQLKKELDQDRLVAKQLKKDLHQDRLTTKQLKSSRDQSRIAKKNNIKEQQKLFDDYLKYYGRDTGWAKEQKKIYTKADGSIDFEKAIHSMQRKTAYNMDDFYNNFPKNAQSLTKNYKDINKNIASKTMAIQMKRKPLNAKYIKLKELNSEIAKKNTQFKKKRKLELKIAGGVVGIASVTGGAIAINKIDDDNKVDKSEQELYDTDLKDMHSNTIYDMDGYIKSISNKEEKLTPDSYIISNKVVDPDLEKQDQGKLKKLKNIGNYLDDNYFLDGIPEKKDYTMTYVMWFILFSGVIYYFFIRKSKNNQQYNKQYYY